LKQSHQRRTPRRQNPTPKYAGNRPFPQHFIARQAPVSVSEILANPFTSSHKLSPTKKLRTWLLVR
jgi:hypothetical protein